jgi:hypothetical protein
LSDDEPLELCPAHITDQRTTPSVDDGVLSLPHPPLPLSSPFRRLRLFRKSLDRNTLYSSHSVTQFGACSPLVAPKSNSLRVMVPVCALCHVSMIACRRRSGLMWCQKNGGRVAASPRLSSMRLVRSWFIRLYTAIASSWQNNLCQQLPPRLHKPFITRRTYPHCTIVALMMWVVMVKAQSAHELVLRHAGPYGSRHSDNE